MDARRKTLVRLSEDAREGFARVAAKGSFNKPAAFGQDEGEGNPFQKGSPGTPAKRDIPADHEFDKKSVKPLVQTLWAMSVALGHALTAHRAFSRLKSSTFSPDGLLGGRGYVLPVKDVRSNLFEACEQLSALCDTLHDEINAPHWRPKIAELEKQDMAEVTKLLGDAEDWIDNPEEEVAEEQEDVEKKPLAKGKQDRFDKDFGSQMPAGGDPETLPAQGPHPANKDHPANRHMKQASSSYSYDRTANSSLAPQTEPGGPRVQHLDRADTDQTGPGGSYNRDETPVADSWGEEGGVSGEPMSQNSGDAYAYPADWSGDISGKSAGSAMPTDTTPSQGWDFGIGDGNGNDAHGQGAGGYGEKNPETGDYGVDGQHAGLPNDPGGKMHDESDSNPSIENSVSESGHMGLPVTASKANYFSFTTQRLSDATIAELFEDASTELPGDYEEPVARSDYYAGPKGNDFNGQVRGQAELPGDASNAVYDYGKDMSPNLGDKVEHGDQPYVRWDDTTHNMRPDPIYQRGPTQGPYPKA